MTASTPARRRGRRHSGVGSVGRGWAPAGSARPAVPLGVVETVRRCGLDTAVAAARELWRKPRFGARSGQGPAGRRTRGGSGRGLPRRCRRAAVRARRVRSGGIRPDCLSAHRRPCRRRTEGADRDPGGSGRSTVPGLGTGRDGKSGRRRLGDRGHRRRARTCALREAGCHRDLEENLRPSSARRARRPRPGRIRRAGRRAAAARQRGLQHRERSHRNHPTRSGPTTQAPAAGLQDADPHRLRRRDPCLPRPALPPGPVAVVLRRNNHHRCHSPGRPEDFEEGMDVGLRRRRHRAARRPGRRDHRHARPLFLAEGNATDRSQGRSAPRRPVAIHRPRPTAAYLLRDQHKARPARRPRTASPPTGSLRGTVSETPETPACATCLCTTPRRTGSGWRSSPSHSTSSPGCRCSP